MLLISAIVTGVAVGSMYGLIALGYHVTYVVSNTVNFSQGSSMMLGAVLGYTFAIRLGWPLPLAIACIVALRPVRSCGRTFPRAAVCRTGLKRLADGDGRGRHRARQHRVVHVRQGAARFSLDPRAEADLLFGAGVFPLQLVIPLVGLADHGCAVGCIPSYEIGKALLAVVQNKDAARLMGINVRVAIALSFALSSALAGLAGLLIAPLFSIHSDMGTLFGIKAFAVAYFLAASHPRPGSCSPDFSTG